MEKVNIIRRYYEDHDMTVRQIAFMMNTSVTSVHRIIKRYGMKNSRTKGSVLQLGATRMTSGGYQETYAPYHPMANADGYVYTHDLIMTAIIGRPLEADEVVHHLDGNKLNNDPKNLRLMKRSEHTRLHSRAYWAQKKGVIS